VSITDLLAGEGLAGADDLVPPVEVALRRAAGIFFDGSTRDFPLDDDGRHVAIHPVDSAMQIALMVGLGTVGSAPDVGNDLVGNEYLEPQRLGARVSDSVRRATASLVARGDVTIEAIDHDTSLGGGLFVSVSYFNNRLPGSRDQRRRSVTNR